MRDSQTPPATFNEYLAEFPPRVRKILRRLRATVRKAAPQAQESISYRMPAYKLHGPLIYFAAYRSHIGLYPIVPSVKKRFHKELAGYAGGKGTLRLPLDEPIPYPLISKIVKFRVSENERRAKAKRK